MLPWLLSGGSGWLDDDEAVHDVAASSSPDGDAASSELAKEQPPGYEAPERSLAKEKANAGSDFQVRASGAVSGSAVRADDAKSSLLDARSDPSQHEEPNIGNISHINELPAIATAPNASSSASDATVPSPIPRPPPYHSSCDVLCDSMGQGCPHCCADQDVPSLLQSRESLLAIVKNFWLPRARFSLYYRSIDNYDYFGNGYGRPGERGEGFMED